MNAILGFGQLLIHDPEQPLTHNQRDCVEQIIEGGYHLLHLINDILDLAKIEAGKIHLSIKSVAIKPLLDKCVDLVKTLAQERSIELVRTYRNNDYFISADYTRTQQVILNLLSNAIKYNHTSGTVTISCQETSAGSLRISVTDTGLGIPNGKRDEIFQPFNRLGVETSSIEGTGIGLTVCRNLIEMMEGRIDFETEPGKGSTFWIELPLLNDREDQEMTRTKNLLKHIPDTGYPSLPGKLLYVEDNPTNVKLMQSLVAKIDKLELITTYTAEEGIELARATRPDIIILDINLPCMNGFEALQKLKQMDETADIPVLALSAYASQSNISKGLEAGFLHYLTKPIQVDRVIRTLQTVLAKNSIRA
jgi:CheY-like chemotaxis protein/two-component sensor histidine kinase